MLTRLEQLTTGVDGLRQAVERERETREREISASFARIDAASKANRRSTLALTLALVLALAGALIALAQNIEDRRQREDLERLFAIEQAQTDQRVVDQCNSSNASRKAIRDSFGYYTDALVATSANTPRTPEEQAAFETRVAAFRADLTTRLSPLNDRDCSPEALGLAAAPNAVS